MFPSWHFPVERLGLVNSIPEFSAGGLIPEERVSVAYAVRQRTWRPVARVIVDERKGPGSAAYAFVGSRSGMGYTLQPRDLDSWAIVSGMPWSGNPRTHVLELAKGAKARP